jgi:hypothetical protein
MGDRQAPYRYFKPRKMASWVTELEDILWPANNIVEKIKKKSEKLCGCRHRYGHKFRFPSTI